MIHENVYKLPTWKTFNILRTFFAIQYLHLGKIHEDISNTLRKTENASELKKVGLAPWKRNRHKGKVTRIYLHI